MDRLLTEIIELGVNVGRNVQGRSWIILHLLVATLHGIRFTCSSILQIRLIQNDTQLRLTDIQENLDTLEMVGAYSLLEHLTAQLTVATRRIGQTEPAYARIGRL